MKELFKKLNIKVYLILGSFIFTLVALISYFININTEYFLPYAPSIGYIVVLIISLIIECAYIPLIFLKENKIFNIAKDVIEMILPGLLMVALMLLFLDRIYYFSIITTYEKNNETMTALASALVSFVACLVSSLIALVGPFLFKKERKEEV